MKVPNQGLEETILSRAGAGEGNGLIRAGETTRTLPCPSPKSNPSRLSTCTFNSACHNQGHSLPKPKLKSQRLSSVGFFVSWRRCLPLGPMSCFPIGWTRPFDYPGPRTKDEAMLSRPDLPGHSKYCTVPLPRSQGIASKRRNGVQAQYHPTRDTAIRPLHCSFDNPWSCERIKHNVVSYLCTLGRGSSELLLSYPLLIRQVSRGDLPKAAQIVATAMHAHEGESRINSHTVLFHGEWLACRSCSAARPPPNSLRPPFFEIDRMFDPARIDAMVSTWILFTCCVGCQDRHR